MKNLLLAVLFSLFSKLVFSQNVPRWEWARNVSVTDTTQITNGICVDSKENIFMTGTNEGSVVIDGRLLEKGQFLAKYDSTGQLQWAENLDFTPVQITCDSQDNLYVISNFTGNISIDRVTLSSHGAADFFIAQLSPSGKLNWVKSYGGTDYDEVTAICVDPNGNLFLTGSYINQTNIDGYIFDSPLSWRSLVLKTDPTGHVLWIQVGDDHMLWAHKIGLDQNNNVYVLGKQIVPNCSYACIIPYIAKYSDNGIPLIHKPFTEWGMYNVIEFKVDGNGEVVLIRSNGRYASYSLEKYDSMINRKWSIYTGGWWCTASNKFSFDLDNDIYILGTFGKSDDPCYSLNYFTDTLRRSGVVDMKLSKFSKDGDYLYSLLPKHPGYVGSSLGGWGINGELAVKNNHLFVTSIYFGKEHADTLCFDLDTIIGDGGWPQAFLAKLKIGNEVVTSQKEKSKEDVLRIFPNPGSGMFNAQSLQKSKICVYDISGNCVYSREALRSQTIDLTGKEKGIYFLEAVAEDKVYRSKLIIE